MRGNKEKNTIITADKAYNILNKRVIQYDQDQQMILSVPNIKSLFSKTPEKWNIQRNKWILMVPQRKKTTWKIIPYNIFDL